MIKYILRFVRRKENIPLNIEKGKLFEEETISTLKKYDFNIKNTKQSHDHGIDFFGKFKSIPILGQCKNEEKALGEKYLRELEGNLHHHNLSSSGVGILVSYNGFTEHGLRYLKNSPCPLICLKIEKGEISYFQMNQISQNLLPLKIGYTFQNNQKKIVFL